MSDESDGYEYTTSVEGNMAIMHEIAKIQFRERLQHIVPLVVQNLIAAGVDFSHVDFRGRKDSSRKVYEHDKCPLSQHQEGTKK